MFLKELAFALDDLPGEAKIRDLKHSIIDQDVAGLNIPMHEVKLMQFLKGVQNLAKIVTYNDFPVHQALPTDLPKIIHQISLVAEFQHDVDDIVVTDDVFDPDNVLVLPQFYQGQDLLPRCGHDVLNSLYLLVGLGDFYNLEGQFYYAVC